MQQVKRRKLRESLLRRPSKNQRLTDGARLGAHLQGMVMDGANLLISLKLIRCSNEDMDFVALRCLAGGQLGNEFGKSPDVARRQGLEGERGDAELVAQARLAPFQENPLLLPEVGD